MAWWEGFVRRDRLVAEVRELRATVADLEERLAFVNDRHGRLLEQEGVPMQENAVLRYDLQKCQRDRQVLEAHLASARGELRLARAVPRGAQLGPPAREAALAAHVEAVLDAFEAWRDVTLRQHPGTADGLLALDPDVEALRSAVVDLRRRLADPDAAGDGGG